MNSNIDNSNNDDGDNSNDSGEEYRLGCRDLKPLQSALLQAKHAQLLQAQQQPQAHLACCQALQQEVQKLLETLLRQHLNRAVWCKSPRDCRWVSLVATKTAIRKE